MKYADSVKAMLLASINEIAADPTKFARNPGKDFTRNRKLSFRQLLLLLLTMEGDCIREELYRYFGRSADAPSKAAFYRQRQKIKDDALRSLLFAFNARLRAKLFNGRYQLVACDGSALDIYRNPDDPDTFFEPNGKSTRGFNQIHVNALYSILDGRFIDLLIQPGRKRNEYGAFCQMVDSLGSPKGHKVIYFCDMGYASYNNFAHVIENGQYFLIRCNDCRTGRILGQPMDGVKELDVHVERILSRSQSKKARLHPEQADRYRYISDSSTLDYITQDNPEYCISLRVVRFELSDGSFENIITNLPDLEFDINDFKDLYHLRWNEETAFRDIKYPLCLKAFHSKKYEYIVQEVWARAILYNFCSEITNHVDIVQGNAEYGYKANFAEACKTCREYLRFHDSPDPIDVEAVIARNIEPIRKGRSFARQHRFKLPVSFCYRT